MTDKQEASFEASVSREFFKAVRRAVEQLNFDGGNIRCIEGPGWLDRKFSFKGDVESMRKLYSMFQNAESQLAAKKSAPKA